MPLSLFFASCFGLSGLYFFTGPAGLCIGSLVVLFWSLLYRSLDPGDFRFLWFFFLLSVSTKILLFLFLWRDKIAEGGYLATYHDAYLYLSKSWSYALYLTEGKDPFVNWGYLTTDYGDNSFTYFLTLWQVLFGQSFVSPYLLNIVVFYTIPLVCFLFVKECCPMPNASLAVFFLLLFFPSLNYWSLDLLRETFNIAALSLLLYSLVLLKRRPFFGAASFLFSFLFLFFSIGEAKWVLCLIPLTAFVQYLFSKGYKREILGALVLFSVLLAALAGIFPEKGKALLESAEAKIVQRQLRTAYIDDAGYYIYPNSDLIGKQEYYAIIKFQPPNNLSYYAEGFIEGAKYYFFAPFPTTSSGNQKKALPQMLLLWYPLLFFFCAGALYAAFRGVRFLVPGLVFYCAYSPVLILTCGNVGQLFRLRDLLTPILVIAAVIGFYAIKARFAPLWGLTNREKIL